MLYAKHSLNYLLSIFIIRRLGLLLCFAIPGFSPTGIIGQHVENARQMGLFRYLQMKNFTHRNTDGPHNPYSKVYDIAAVKRDFSEFSVKQSHKEFMHAPPLPVDKLPFSRLLGWHLWVHMAPKP